jgi:hypothetical protein
MNAWLNEASGGAFNVKSHGALGDGVTDDSVAIQAAIDACSAAGGGTVFLPEGTYVLDAKVDLEGGVDIRGAGRGSTKVLVTQDLALGVREGAFTATIDNDNITIEGISFEDETEKNRLVSFTECSHIKVRGCSFANASIAGGISHVLTIFHASGASADYTDFLIEDNYFETAFGAMLVQGAGAGFLDNVRVVNNVVSGERAANATDGVVKLDKRLRRVLATGNVIDGGGVAAQGLQVEEGVVDVVLRGNIVRRMIDQGIHIGVGQTDDACQNVQIIGNKVLDITGGDGHGVFIDVGTNTAKNYAVTDNLFHNLDGYVVWDNSAGLSHLLIADNTVLEYAGAFAFQLRGSHTVVAGNLIETATDTGFVQAFATAEPSFVVNNVLNRTGTTAVAQFSGASRLTIRDNLGTGLLTEANGTATLINGSTAVVVTHGLGVTPDIEDISVTPIEAWGAATQFWISTPTSTQFTIEVDQDPGQDVDFAWTASVQ